MDYSDLEGLSYLILEMSAYIAYCFLIYINDSLQKCLCLSTVNQYFGFGLMNAEAMINRSLSWKTVPDQVVCKSSNMILNR